MNPLKTYQNLTSGSHLLVLASEIERGRGSRWKVLPLGQEVLTKLERLPFLSIGNLLLVVQLQPLLQFPSGSCLGLSVHRFSEPLHWKASSVSGLRASICKRFTDRYCQVGKIGHFRKLSIKTWENLKPYIALHTFTDSSFGSFGPPKRDTRLDLYISNV